MVNDLPEAVLLYDKLTDTLSVKESDYPIVFLRSNRRIEIEKRYEGNGFDTPEQVVTEYAKALQNKDFEALVSLFAIESYCAYNRASVLDIEERYETVVDRLKTTISSIILGMNNAYGDASQPYLSYFVESDPGDLLKSINELSDIQLGPFVYGETFDPDRYTFFSLGNIYKEVYQYGAQGYKTMGLLFEMDGYKGLLTAGTICYDGRWYLTDRNYLSIFLGFSLQEGDIVVTNDLIWKSAFENTDTWEWEAAQERGEEAFRKEFNSDSWERFCDDNKQASQYNPLSELSWEEFLEFFSFTEIQRIP